MKSQRRGLAPLEFVMCLPVLLFVLALMVDTGSKSCWKLRGMVAARDAAWRTRFERSSGPLGNPVAWPPPATMGVSPSGPNGRLESAPLNHPVVRGPTLGTFLVKSELLDQTRGGWVGQSQRTWTPPLLPKLGAAALNQQHPLIDNKWQYSQMGIPSTFWRRIPFIYILPQTDPELKAAYLAAVDAVQTAPFRRDLDVLDRDEEIRAYYGNYHNFHPRVTFCDYDRPRVTTNQRASLVRRIQGGLTTQKPRNGIPGQLARFWINMYSQQLQAMKAAGATPSNSPAAAALQAQIDVLKAYLNMLP
jgi:hypothetical protein